MYTDTGIYRYNNIIIIKLIFFPGSLIYNIKTADFYDDLLNKPEILQRMDTSNLSIDHPCYCTDRKKLPGTFTDETKGVAFIYNSY